MNHIPDSLRAWAPLIASGYEVPAASTVMFQAAELIEQQAAEIERLKQRSDTASRTTIRDDVLRCSDEQANRLYNATEGCDGIIVDAQGGGVKCTKCGGWFCF